MTALQFSFSHRKLLPPRFQPKPCSRRIGSWALLGLIAAWTFCFLPGSAAAEPDQNTRRGKATTESFQPLETAQLSPGRVKILEGQPKTTEGSKLQFTENKLKQAGFILPETKQVGKIIANLENYYTYSTGEIVYIDIGTEQGVQAGDRFTIIAKDHPVFHPVIHEENQTSVPDYQRSPGEPYPAFFSHAGKFMGFVVNILGYLEVLESTQGSSKSVIRETYRPISDGSLVTPYRKVGDPPAFPEVKPPRPVEGYMIAFRNDLFYGALNDIVYIDMGRNQNVSPGDRFEVYTDFIPSKKAGYGYESGHTLSIPHVVGEIQVIDTEEETATAVITQSSRPLPLGSHLRYKPVEVVARPLNDVLALQEAPSYEPEDVEIPIEKPVEPKEEEPFAVMEPPPVEREEGQAELLSFRPTQELADVHFQFDKWDLDSISQEILHKNLEYLKEHPGMKVQIEGHCDERGTNNYNLALGERRAGAVKNYLASQGIEEDRMHLISYGEEKPLCFKSEENCWRQNRRVHFLINDAAESVN
ncbi:MAG: peptidoglycan-associated lipoprotein Pal [Nitrospinaceae bacterium]